MECPDIIVVGAGGSGAALAARLSEDSNRSVLLLEAGSVPHQLSCFSDDLLDARLVPGAQPGHRAVGHHAVSLAPDRPYTVMRGRVLGGSTTVNGGYFIRARKSDFARWAAAGGPAWSYDRMLPMLCSLENDLDHGAADHHGNQGPVPVRRTELDHPVASAFAAAARELGFPEEPDKNAQEPPGFGPVPVNVIKGRRINTGISYLLGALGRPNLRVEVGCRVRSIAISRGRATGVVVERDRQLTVLPAGEVVLCAGALASPHILMASGIGPATDLHRLGIPVIENHPGVGARFSDHPQVTLEWTPSSPLPVPVESWIGGALHTSSSDGTHPGDLEILQSLVPLEGLVSGRTEVPGAPHALLVSVQTPVASGRLTVNSADPNIAPKVQYGYLRTADDRRRMREAVRTAASLILARAFGDVSTGLSPSMTQVLRDDSLLDGWVRACLGTAHHTCGTVPMGPATASDAVVDPWGRVHGLDRLRVADTSILPTAPLRGPAATAVLIGEFVAQAMTHEPSQLSVA